MHRAIERSGMSGRPGHASPAARASSNGHHPNPRPKGHPLFRQELVRRVRSAIEAGTYETPARIDRTVELVIRRLSGGR